MTTEQTARARMTAYLQQAGLSTARAEANIDALLAEQLALVPSAAETTNRAALRDRIAEALAAKFTRDGGVTEGMRVLDDSDLPVPRRPRPTEVADAVLAVLPAPVDRAAVLREAADAITDVIDADRAYSPRRSNDRAALGAAREIVLGLIDNPRRLAEAPQPETQAALCGRTRSTSGEEYPPCARSAGHAEAYCRSADGNAYFLGATAAPAVVAQPGKEG